MLDTMMVSSELRRNPWLTREISVSRCYGFTLIELLVVVIILGVLAAASLPALVRQIGKGRESEVKIGLGTFSRAQQAYHFEKGTFANTSATLNLNGSVESNYYTFPDPNFADDQFVRHQGIAKAPFVDQVRNYSVGVYFDSGLYQSLICQGSEIGKTVEAPNTETGGCSNGGVLIK